MQFKLVTTAIAFFLVSQAAAMVLDRQTEPACHPNPGNTCVPEIARQCCAPLVCLPPGTVTGVCVVQDPPPPQ
ncbi:hypothetical protein FB45DRAFT_942548 [Roridomyces roridus]|uniref:Uncharacterized protein n=1 Tax=Roridomyces roridus TaxID=1738132 RepID=A0AAD7B5F3_9AGAR|nr:hypothetical protein FB45DRAFT_942548 [Roridomyces roridus]